VKVEADCTHIQVVERVALEVGNRPGNLGDCRKRQNVTVDLEVKKTDGYGCGGG